MIKSILVCTDGSRHGKMACETAIHLARKFSAHIRGLHVLDSRLLEGPLMADISGWIGAQPYAQQLEQFHELLQKKGESILEEFETQCREAHLSPESSLVMGHPARTILEEEARSELVVIGQKGEHADVIGDMMGSNAERVVRQSVKPCLVTPLEFRPVEKILVAYDGSGHAGEALRESIEMAQALQVGLVVLTVSDEEDLTDPEQIAHDAMELAQAHDCPVETVVKTGDASTTILEVAREKDCSLIAAGAHGHSRIREMFLGSTTMDLIGRSDLPVLLVR